MHVFHHSQDMPLQQSCVGTAPSLQAIVADRLNALTLVHLAPIMEVLCLRSVHVWVQRSIAVVCMSILPLQGCSQATTDSLCMTQGITKESAEACRQRYATNMSLQRIAGPLGACIQPLRHGQMSSSGWPVHSAADGELRDHAQHDKDINVVPKQCRSAVLLMPAFS